MALDSNQWKLYPHAEEAPAPDPVPTPNGWYGLLSIQRVAQEMYREDLARPVTSCRYDGEPLLSGGRSGTVRFCRYCGWRPGSTTEATVLDNEGAGGWS